MALPSGSMTSSDFPYTLAAADTPEYIYFCFRIPYDPKHYADEETWKTMFGRCFTMVDIGASTDLIQRIAADGGITTTWYDSETGADADTWISHGTSTSPLQGQLLPIDLSDSSTHPRGITAQVAFERDGAGVGAIHSVFLTDWHGIAYDGEPAEVQPRGGANTLYYKNRFCSSYDLIFGLCETLNRLMYQNRVHVSFIP